mmetsp:Transcript_8427/g.21008  ORF Transcript_8427/g.21008 Transcript_8427/m.21008 type:complete len:224 (+) Transcript_8427:2851-3522(+)
MNGREPNKSSRRSRSSTVVTLIISVTSSKIPSSSATTVVLVVVSSVGLVIPSNSIGSNSNASNTPICPPSSSACCFDSWKSRSAALKILLKYGSVSFETLDAKSKIASNLIKFESGLIPRYRLGADDDLDSRVVKSSCVLLLGVVVAVAFDFSERRPLSSDGNLPPRFLMKSFLSCSSALLLIVVEDCNDSSPTLVEIVFGVEEESLTLVVKALLPTLVSLLF